MSRFAPNHDHLILLFFLGYLLGSYFLKKSIKIRLLNNVQTVLRHMNQPQEEEIRLPICVWVELAARPTKKSPYFFGNNFNFQNNVDFLFHRK